MLTGIPRCVFRSSVNLGAVDYSVRIEWRCELPGLIVFISLRHPILTTNSITPFAPHAPCKVARSRPVPQLTYGLIGQFSLSLNPSYYFTSIALFQRPICVQRFHTGDERYKTPSAPSNAPCNELVSCMVMHRGPPIVSG